MTVDKSQRITLKEVSIELKLGAMPNASAINEILYYARSKGLTIYFDNSIYGVKTSGTFDEILDQYGNLDKVMISETPSLCEGQKELNAPEMIQNWSEISFNSFHYKEESYYITDEPYLFIDSICLSIDDFYCLKLELNEFKTKRLNKPIKKDKPSVQSKREDALKIFLQQDPKHNTECFQSLYEAIGSPTQNTLWASLKQHEPELFKAGDSDFFKNQKVISFKYGTGNGRR